MQVVLAPAVVSDEAPPLLSAPQPGGPAVARGWWLAAATTASDRLPRRRSTAWQVRQRFCGPIPSADLHRREFQPLLMAEDLHDETAE